MRGLGESGVGLSDDLELGAAGIGKVEEWALHYARACWLREVDDARVVVVDEADVATLGGLPRVSGLAEAAAFQEEYSTTDENR